VHANSHDPNEPVEDVTLGELMAAVIEVTEDDHEAVAVVVHMLESGRVRVRGPRKRDRGLRERRLKETG
jgi:hypothetical protein